MWCNGDKNICKLSIFVFICKKSYQRKHFWSISKSFISMLAVWAMVTDNLEDKVNCDSSEGVVGHVHRKCCTMRIAICGTTIC